MSVKQICLGGIAGVRVGYTDLENPESLEVIEVDPSKLLDEDPVVERTYYWYRSQLERAREAE